MGKLGLVALSVILAAVAGAAIALVVMAKFAPQPATKITNRTFVVEETKMTNLVIYATDKVFTTVEGQEGRKIPFTNITILPSGQMVMIFAICEAGVDFKANPPRVDYNKERTSVHIAIQNPQVIGCRLDGPPKLVGTGGDFPVSTDLSNKLLVAATQQLEEEAIRGGIIEKARRPKPDYYN